MGKKGRRVFGRKRRGTAGGAVPRPGAGTTSSFDNECAELPPLVVQCIERLESELCLEGIFRVPGSVRDITEISTNFAKGKDVDLSQVDGHTVGGVLKKFLRELPNPLCTFELYDCFLAAGSVPFRASRVSCVQKVLELLPAGNFALLKSFCHLLSKIAAHASKNLMKASNLAIVFAPTLLRPRHETMDEMFSDASQTNGLVEQFVLDYAAIFENEPVEDGETQPSGSKTKAAAREQAPPARTSAPPTRLPSATPQDKSDQLKRIGKAAPISLVASSIPSPITDMRNSLPPSLVTKQPLDRSQSNISTSSSDASTLSVDQKTAARPVSTNAVSLSQVSSSDEKKESNAEFENSYKARALWDFEAELEDELSFSSGAILTVFPDKVDKAGFLYGRLGMKSGWFQGDYVEKLQLCIQFKAKRAYTPEAGQSHLLQHEKGDQVIAWTEGAKDGWWQGTLNGKVGLFYRPFFEEESRVDHRDEKSTQPAVASGEKTSGGKAEASPATTPSTDKASEASEPVRAQAVNAQRNFYRMMSFVNLDKVAASALQMDKLSPQPARNQKTKPAVGPRTTTSAAAAAAAKVGPPPPKPAARPVKTQDPGSSYQVPKSGESQEKETEKEDHGAGEEEYWEEGEEGEYWEEGEGGEYWEEEEEGEYWEEEEEEEAANDSEWVRALHDYAGRKDTPELTFKKGCILRVVQRFGSGWLEAEMDDGTVGYAPGTFVESCALPDVK